MPINVDDFDYIRHLVRQRSSIVLDNGKETLVESRLSILARKEGYGSVNELVSRLRSPTPGKLQEQVVEALTTNETLFFRDIYPFEALKRHLLPKVLKRRESDPTARLHILSAGCSSGQEPYSVAMLLKEHFPSLPVSAIRIIGVDLSKEMVARSREGRYTQFEVNRGLPAPMLVKYFHQKGVDWQLREDVRRMVDFEEFNLAGSMWPPLPLMDVIFMRNVLIYFDVETKKAILQRIKRLLRPESVLFLGTAETTLNLDESFERIQFEKAWCYKLRT